MAAVFRNLTVDYTTSYQKSPRLQPVSCKASGVEESQGLMKCCSILFRLFAIPNIFTTIIVISLEWQRHQRCYHINTLLPMRYQRGIEVRTIELLPDSITFSWLTHSMAQLQLPKQFSLFCSHRWLEMSHSQLDVLLTVSLQYMFTERSCSYFSWALTHLHLICFPKSCLEKIVGMKLALHELQQSCIQSPWRF